jgi:hypothetical protein
MATHRLTKVKSNHRVADGSFEGFFVFPPKKGDHFLFYTPAQVGQGSILTTRLQEVRTLERGTIEFDTKNSTYRLERLSEPPALPTDPLPKKE